MSLWAFSRLRLVPFTLGIAVCSAGYNLISSFSRKAAVNPIELIVLLVDFARQIFILGRQEPRRHGIGGARIVDDGHSRDSFQQRRRPQ